MNGFLIQLEFINNSLSNQKMDSISETLRKAREVQQRYKLFMSRKVQQDKSIEETFKKIQRTQQTLKQTRETIGSIDKLYTRLEQVLSESIDAAVKSVEKHSLLHVAQLNFQPNRVNAKKVADMLKEKKKILVLTGAGMSAASGIPTFRGANGFWTRQKVQVGSKEEPEQVSPQTLLTLRFFKERPMITWQWLDYFYNLKIKAKINKGHEALNDILQQLARKGKQVCMVTQNIDNFHVQAQNLSKKTNKNFKGYPIYEIHGNILKIRCDKCSQQKKQLCYEQYQRYNSILNDGKTVLCPKCQTPLRPHVMFFDQIYDQTINRCDTIRQFLKEADAVLVIGTALQTGFSNEIVMKAYESEKQIVQINSSCEIRRKQVWWLQEKSQVILNQVKINLLKK